MSDVSAAGAGYGRLRLNMILIFMVWLRLKKILKISARYYIVSYDRYGRCRIRRSLQIS